MELHINCALQSGIWMSQCKPSGMAGMFSNSVLPTFYPGLPARGLPVLKILSKDWKCASQVGGSVVSSCCYLSQPCCPVFKHNYENFLLTRYILLPTAMLPKHSSNTLEPIFWSGNLIWILVKLYNLNLDWSSDMNQCGHISC